MIERVAKAEADYDKRPWMAMPAADRRRYLDRARLSIEAMRTPTPLMVDAGETAVDNAIDETSDSYHSYKVYSEDEVAIAAWGAMIDAALTAHPHPEAECRSPPHES